MRSQEQKSLNVSCYSNYKEVLISSAKTPIALSIYEASQDCPNIIFLPGTMTHPLFYDEFLSLLAGLGFNVIGVHFISHGKSPRERDVYTFEDMLENVRDTISYCEKFYGSNIGILGSSQGGILSIASAADPRVKAVFPHNILLPSLSDSVEITSFPGFFRYFYKAILVIMRIGAKVFPKLQLPITAYLEFDRITKSKEIKNRFYADPIGLTKYPLIFLSSLFSANLSSLLDGSIKCPVIVIASKKDTLFSFEYCCKVYDRIAAPKKDMLVFDEPYHLILNECVDSVINPIALKIKEYLCC